MVVFVPPLAGSGYQSNYYSRQYVDELWENSHPFGSGWYSARGPGFSNSKSSKSWRGPGVWHVVDIDRAWLRQGHQILADRAINTTTSYVNGVLKTIFPHIWANDYYPSSLSRRRSGILKEH